MFTSDNWDPFEEGLVNIYGFLETPHYAGIGRKPYPILVPYPNLKYAKVSKIRRNGRVIEVVQSVVFGEPKEVMKLLGADSGGSINTAYIERLNLTIRNSLARGRVCGLLKSANNGLGMQSTRIYADSI